MTLNKKQLLAFCLLTLTTTITLCHAKTEKTIYLSDMDLTKMTSGWSVPVANKSVQNKPLTMAGIVYENGVGTHSISKIYIDLKGTAKSFSALAGLDDEINHLPYASIVFRILGDGKEIFKSQPLKVHDKPIQIDLPLKNIKTLLLIVDSDINGSNCDHADWVNAKITYTGQTPKAIDPPIEKPYILTPPPSPKPKINSPLVYGARPTHEFIYRIPATGIRPMTFQAKDLPDTLTLDKTTGIITGTVPETPGEYKITFNAKNKLGQTQKDFKLIVGDTLALTPPMGWNHWYTHYNWITHDLTRKAAKSMIDSGLADFGYQYVNIDDCWMNASDEHFEDNRKGPFRDDKGNILCNKFFPDMYALTDYIHSLGLKAGIYTSAGPMTCAKFAGTYNHEQQDVTQFARWGFDFLKHDFCFYDLVNKDPNLAELKHPYFLIGQMVKNADRDIVFNICQGSEAEVWKWGEKAGGQTWRTAGDLIYELENYHRVAHRNSKYKDYAHPGAWNDPDFLVLGQIGKRPKDGTLVPCPLSPSEQYSYMSLWCLMASPLFFSGDIATLDPFTKNILCNSEVIEINQDPLGKQGYPVITKDETDIWIKPLHDGSTAVGIFNLAEREQKITINLKDLNLKGQYKMRDLWRQKNLGTIKTTYTTKIPRHGVTLLRLYPK